MIQDGLGGRYERINQDGATTNPEAAKGPGKSRYYTIARCKNKNPRSLPTS
jgi:hypothetical protein